VLDDKDLETRLRDALSRAAPRGLPTIGVRERIVDAVRGRRARRQRLAGGLAAACLVVAGVSVGAVALHQSSNGGKTGGVAALGRPSASGGERSDHGPLNPAASTSTLPVPRANCGEIAVGGSVVGGCYGVFGSSPTTFGPSGYVPASSANLGVQKKTGGHAGHKAAGVQALGGYQVVVPVGRPVTVLLPGSAGEIWTAPAIVPGQGTDAARVRAIAAHVSGAGQGSSATFESTVAVTVVIDASALTACGEEHTPCGMPTSFWSVVLEFRAG
jgi:hypothetical protein